jgi:hypothetical protein
MHEERLTSSMYWMAHLAGNAPGLLADCAVSYAWRRVAGKPNQPKLLIGTHHKVLTVFLGRVFRAFAMVANRSVSQGRGAEVDYRCEILLDHHSEFDLSRVDRPYAGLHVVRDPRDLLVSATFYHQRADEPWLHVARPEFEGRTYQQHINRLPDMEQRLLFELDHSSGMNIEQMLAWTGGRPGIAELRYDELVGSAGAEVFERTVGRWGLDARDARVLGGLFRYFSLEGAGARNNRHIRNADTGQWHKHFTPAVQAKFDARFPDAAGRLGFAD